MQQVDQTVLTDKDRQVLADARASFSAFLGMHFLNLPDEDFIGKLRLPEIQEFLGGLAHDPDVNRDIGEGARLMLDYLRQTRDESLSALSEAMGIDRTRVYRGVSPDYGPPPPYEATWSGRTEQPMVFLQEMAGLYARRGLVQTSETHERLDYVGIELFYLESLAREEARTLRGSKIDEATGLLSDQAAFVSEHLSVWVPRFVAAALEHARTDFYRGHLLMLRGFVLEQAEVLPGIAGSN